MTDLIPIRLSHYVLDFPCPDQPGQGLLYSTRKGSSCLLGRETIDGLKQGRCAESLVQPLTRLGMLTDDPEREREEMLSFPETLDRLSSTLRVLITLGMGCNFDCSYCYQGFKGHERLDDLTTAQLIRCIQDLCSPKTEKINLSFYGGEPLLYLQRIREVAGSLQSWGAQQNISFGFGLVSNGSLLTPEITRELTRLGLKSVKITLDGPPVFHNQSRPYKNGTPSFDRIIHNMKACCRMVPITIGGNYSRDSYPHFPQLLDIFLEKGLGPDTLKSISFSPIIQTDASRKQGHHTGCNWCGEPWVAEATVFLRHEILKRGFPTPRLSPSPCMMQRKNMVMINWDGRFYKCPVLINRPEFAIGRLPDLPDQVQTDQTQEYRKDTQCRACRYLPLCFGGCALMRLERNGTLKGTDCWRPFYEKIIPEMVLQDLEFKQVMEPKKGEHEVRPYHPDTSPTTT